MFGKKAGCQGAPARGGGEKGSVFTTLLAAAAVIGSISVMTWQTLSGPVATMARATKKAQVDQQLVAIASNLLNDGGNCDADALIEPPVWTDAASGTPAGGGLLPTNIGLRTIDPWGTPYGYCGWDTGAAVHAGCGAAGRLQGSPDPSAGAAASQVVLAVISAGPDRQFNTTCSDYNAGAPAAALVSTASGKDDIFVSYTYAAATASSSDIWKAQDADTAEVVPAIDKLEVGDLASETPTHGRITAGALTASGVVSAGGGLQLSDNVANGLCDGAGGDDLPGALRYSGGAVQFCDGGTADDWTAVGSGGGGGGPTETTYIDDLSDGVSDYPTNHLVGLGAGALDSYADAASENDVTDSGTIVRKVVPTGGGNPDTEVIRNNVRPAIGTNDANLQYDTYCGNCQGADDWIGYTFGASKTFSKVVFQEGMHFSDGGWFTSLKVQVRQAGVWNDVASLVSTPAYPGTNNGSSFETYTLTFTPMAGDGIRIFGAPGGTATFMSVGELDVYEYVPPGAGGTATPAPRNTAVGFAALASNSGTDNTAFGYQALRQTTTGSSNTGLGWQSLRNNTTGSDNTAAGYGALQSNATAAQANISVVQVTPYMAYASTKTGTFTFDAAPAVGNTIIVGVYTECSLPVAAGVTDNNGGGSGSYTLAGKTYFGTEDAQIFYRSNIGSTGTPFTVTVTKSGCAGSMVGLAMEVSGLANSSPVDQAINNATHPAQYLGFGGGSSNTWATTTQANELAVTMLRPPATDVDLNQHSQAGWTLAGKNDQRGSAVAYRVLSAAGTVTHRWTYTHPWTAEDILVTFKGANTGTVTGGAGNTALGYNALAANTGGLYNTAAGYEALKSVTVGKGNTAAGTAAADAVVWGDYNTAAGTDALGAYTGDGGTAFGYNALKVATGNANTAFGYNTGVAVTTGTGNTVAGYNAFAKPTTGSFNTAMGYDAGSAAGTGNTDYATAVGSEALRVNRVSGATAIGHTALALQTTATGNTALGAAGCYTTSANGYNENTLVGQGIAQTCAGGGTGGNTAIGVEALRDSGSTSTTVAFGWTALVSIDAGAGNVGVGGRALYANGTFSGQTALGYGALASSALNYHTAAGIAAFNLLSSTSADGLAIGPYAADAMTGGNANVAFGSNAHGVDTIGRYNVSFGKEAGIGIRSTATNADANVAFGYRAHGKNTGTPGLSNNVTAFGSGALQTGTTTNSALDGSTCFGMNACQNARQYTIAMGFEAGLSTTGSGVLTTGFGWKALRAATTGANTALGSEALAANTTGSGNTAIGFQTMRVANTGANAPDQNTAVGWKALTALTTGDSNTAAGYQALAANTSADESTALGYQALLLSTGAANTAAGAGALAVNTTGANNTAVGYGAGPTTAALSNTIAIGNGATVSASNTARFGNASVVKIEAAVGYTSFSDRRLKKDIKNSDLALDFIMKLRPVSYRMKTGNGRLDYGFIAQEAEAALEGRVTNIVTRDADAAGTYGMRSAEMLAPLVGAVQQQERALEKRQADIDALKAEALELRRMLEEGQ